MLSLPLMARDARSTTDVMGLSAIWQAGPPVRKDEARSDQSQHDEGEPGGGQMGQTQPGRNVSKRALDHQFAGCGKKIAFLQNTLFYSDFSSAER